MSIIHIQKRDNPYVQIDKRPLDNDKMSWRAKGLLCYLLSKPSDWTVCLEDLIKSSKDGKDAVYNIVKELLEVGHMKRIPTRINGKFSGWDYTVFEVPQPISGKTGYGETGCDKTRYGKSATSNNEITNNEKNKIDANASPLNSQSLKQPKKKKEKEPDAEVVHQDFVDAWHKFKEARTPADEEVFVRPEDYRHLKAIREQLIKRKKGDKNKALSTWQYILNNWGKLEDFLQKMDDTSQINRYMEKFLIDLRAKYQNVTTKSAEIKNETLTNQQVDDLMGGLNPNYKPEPLPAPLFPLT